MASQWVQDQPPAANPLSFKAIKARAGYKPENQSERQAATQPAREAS